MTYPIASLGKYQLKDIEDSHDIVLHDEFFRVCNVGRAKIPDHSWVRMKELFGGKVEDYEYHFIVQIAGCPLRCKYCYVDNLKEDKYILARELVFAFMQFRKIAILEHGINFNVLHIMGGCPGAYPQLWQETRWILDNLDYKDIIIFSNVIFVENYFFGTRPWNFMDISNFMLSGCLKGTSHANFIENSRRDLFREACKELRYYIEFSNFYLTLVDPDMKNTRKIHNVIDKSRIDIWDSVEYEAVKARKQGLIR